MRRYALPLAILAFAIIGGSAGVLLGGYVYDNPPAPPGIEQVDIGEPIPAFSLPDAAGMTQSLSQWQGRLLVMNYWASWCPPCIEEMPLLDAFARDHADRGMTIVGIAEDDPDAARAFLAKNPVDYPVLFGDGQFAGSSMQLGNSRNVLPYTVVIGADGRLLERKAGMLDTATLEGWLDRYSPTTR